MTNAAYKEQDMINKVLGAGPASTASRRVPADAQSQASRASRASAAVPQSETSGKFSNKTSTKLIILSLTTIICAVS